jgi:hypothetical protein
LGLFKFLKEFLKWLLTRIVNNELIGLYLSNKK